jgi:hypothetical protein
MPKGKRKKKWFCWMNNITDPSDDQVYVFLALTREEAARLARDKAAQRGGEYLDMVYAAPEFKAVHRNWYNLVRDHCDN